MVSPVSVEFSVSSSGAELGWVLRRFANSDLLLYHDYYHHQEFIYPIRTYLFNATHTTWNLIIKPSGHIVDIGKEFA